MTDLEAFLSKVLPYAPGCPEPVAFEHIRNAAIEFCEETKLWRHEDAFDLGDEPNLLCVPQDASILDIERVDWNGTRLEPATVGWLDDRHADWRSSTKLWQGEPSWFVQLAPDTIRVVPMPYAETTPRVVSVSLRLKPSEEAELLPDFLAEHHRTLIGWGALGAILMLPNQTFSAPDRATYYQAKFDQGLGRKSKLQQKGQQRGPVRMKANFF